MKKYLIGAVFSLGILFFFLFFRCSQLSCISITHLAPFQKQEVYESTRKTFRAVYTTASGLFRIEKQASLSSSDAETLTKATVMTIQGLFANARSPYPGPLSDEIVCDNKFKSEPELYTTDSTAMTTLIAYANSRLQYGSCIDDQILYKGYIAMFYCKNHASWYKAELLIPIAEATEDASFMKRLHTIQCR